MAYNPKSYRKFVAASASAALVASAVAPAAVSAADSNFTDISDNYRHADAVNALYDLGVTQGYEDGTFRPQNNLTRGEAALFVYRALGLDAGDVDALEFEDVPSRYAEAVAALNEAGIMNGLNDTTFGTDQNISRGQMAAVIVRAYGLDQDVEDQGFGDINASATLAPFVNALAAAGYTEGYPNGDFGVHDDIKRGDFAAFLFRAYEDHAGELAVRSVVAENSTTLTAKFAKALSDDAEIELLREGGATVNISELTFNSANTEATLELPTKFVGGEYTLVVTDGDSEVEFKFELEDERVEEITIPSDVAIANNNTNPTEVTIAYQVLNQYGENISDATSLTATSSNGSPNTPQDGKLTVVNSNGFQLDSYITVSLLHGASGTYASKTVKVSTESRPASFEIEGLYHAEGYTPRADDSTTGYFFLFKAEDQYGNSLTSSELGTEGSTYVLNSSNTNVATLDTSSVDDVVIDGEEFIRVPFSNSNFGQGTTVFNLISATTGESESYTLEVPSALAVHDLTLGAPSLAVAGETVNIPFTALDQNGDAVTNVSVLNDVNFSISNTPAGLDDNDNIEFKMNWVENEAYLELDLTGVTLTDNQNVTIIGTTVNGKVAQRAITIRPNAQVASIAGLKNVEENVITGESITLEHDNISFKDQYGRTMSTSPSFGTSDGEYEVRVSSNNAVVALSGTQVGSVYTINSPTASVTLTGTQKGSANITLSLFKYDNGEAKQVSNSAYRFASNVINKEDVVELELGSVAVLNDISSGDGDAGHADSDFEVYGVDKNGNKALIPVGDITFTSTSDVLSYNTTTGKVSVNNAPAYAGNAQTADVNYVATVYGNQIDGLIKVTKEKAVQSSLIYNDNGWKAVDGATIAESASNINTLADVKTHILDTFVVRDQYNATMLSSELNNYTVSQLRHVNGNKLTDISQVSEGSSFVVTVLLQNGEKVTFTVVLE